MPAARYITINPTGPGFIQIAGVTAGGVANADKIPALDIAGKLATTMFPAEVLPPQSIPVVYTQTLGKTYANLLGSPPSILTRSWRTWATSLKDHRLANCPLTKANTYYFANSGSDANAGTEASPWATVARANEICAPLNGQRMDANQLTPPSSAPFALAGSSWWMGGWVKNNNNSNYGPLFEIENSYGFFSGALNNTPGFFYWIGGVRQDVVGPGPMADPTAWNYIEAWFDTATRQLSICINNGTVSTTTRTAQMDASALPLVVGQGFAGTAFGGDSARYFFVRDVVPTNANRAAMYNSGKGCRSYLLPAALKAIFTSNSGSFWDFAGASGTTTYADAFSGRTLTRSAPQGPVNIPGPDADAVLTSTGAGGANIACLFKRGDRFEGGLTTITRANLTLADYGAGVIAKPVLSLFTVPITNTWTLVSGTRYKRACAAVGWVKKKGDDYLPFGLVLTKTSSAVNCGATTNSFFYDTVGGELHLNVGADPATVSAAGWEGTVRGPTIQHGITGNCQRLENLILLGSGIMEPGNPSGYGLQVTGIAQEEHVLKGLEVFYTGYHAIGHISTKAIATWIECKAGLCSNRNESGAVGAAANGTVYVAFCGNGDQEMVMWDCEVTHGTLPSYDWTGVDGMGGVLAHVGASGNPALMISYRTNYAVTGYPCGYGTTFGTLASGTWAGQRAWVVEEVVSSTYRSGFSVPAAADGNEVVVVGYRAALPLLGASGYLLGGRGYYLLNCTLHVDCTGYATTFNVFGNVASNTAYRAISCRFDVANSQTGGLVTIGDISAAGVISGPWQNTILTVGGTATVALGTAPTGMFDHCAFKGLAGVGVAPVNLTATPLLSSSHNVWQLYGVGLGDLAEYDAYNVTRSVLPTIGPFELGATSQLPLDVARKSLENNFLANQLITGTLGVSGALTSGSLVTGSITATGNIQSGSITVDNNVNTYQIILTGGGVRLRDDFSGNLEIMNPGNTARSGLRVADIVSTGNITIADGNYLKTSAGEIIAGYDAAGFFFGTGFGLVDKPVFIGNAAASYLTTLLQRTSFRQLASFDAGISVVGNITASGTGTFQSTGTHTFGTTNTVTMTGGVTKLTANSAGYTPTLWVSDNNSVLGAVMYFEWRGAAVGNKVKSFAVDSNGLGFYRMNDGGGSFANFTPDLLIDPSGNVGIGTTSPSEKLTVTGNITASGTGTFGSNLKVYSGYISASNGAVLALGSGYLQSQGGMLYLGNSGLSTIITATAGNLLLTNWAGTGFDRIQLGGTTASFPAIKRSGTAINFRLADDSADAPITVANITASGTGTFGNGVVITDTGGANLKVNNVYGGYQFLSGGGSTVYLQSGSGGVASLVTQNVSVDYLTCDRVLLNGGGRILPLTNGVRIMDASQSADGNVQAGNITASGTVTGSQILSTYSTTGRGFSSVVSSGWMEFGDAAALTSGSTAKIAFWADTLGLIQVASNGALGWSSQTWAANGSGDSYISRNAAGVLQIGTTANNALGSLALANITASGTGTFRGPITVGTIGGGSGAMRMQPGDASSGFLEWYESNGSRSAYMGYGSAGSINLFIASGSLVITATNVSSSGNMQTTGYMHSGADFYANGSSYFRGSDLVIRVTIAGATGNITASGTGTFGGKILAGNTGPSFSPISLSNSNAGIGNRIAVFESPANGSSFYGIGLVNSVGFGLGFFGGTGGAVPSDSNYGMVLNNSNNLIIGATTDNGSRLQVTGNITASGTVTSTGILTATAGIINNGSVINALAAKTASYTLTLTDHYIRGDATTAAITITLPTAVGYAGLTYRIKKIDSSVNAVTIATTASQTIDGASTSVLSAQYQHATLISNGTNWDLL